MFITKSKDIAQLGKLIQNSYKRRWKKEEEAATLEPLNFLTCTLTNHQSN